VTIGIVRETSAVASEPLTVPTAIERDAFVEMMEILNPSEAQLGFLKRAYDEYAAAHETFTAARQPVLDEISLRLQGFPSPSALMDAAREWRACLQQCASLEEQLWNACTPGLTDTQVEKIESISLTRESSLWREAGGQEPIAEAEIDLIDLIREYPTVRKALGNAEVAYARTRVALLRDRAFAYADVMAALGSGLRRAGITDEMTKEALSDPDVARVVLEAMVPAANEAADVSFKQSVRLANLNQRYANTIKGMVEPATFRSLQQEYWGHAFPELYAESCDVRDTAEALLQIANDRAAVARAVRQYDLAVENARRRAQPTVRSYHLVPKVDNNRPADSAIVDQYRQTLSEFHAQVQQACEALAEVVDVQHADEDGN